MRTVSGTPGKSAGSRLQHRIFYALIGRLGVHAAYVLLFFVVSWYTLKPSTAARCRPYLERRFPGCGRMRMLARIWKLQWNFGLCLVDRAAAGISGRFFFAGDALSAICGPARDGERREAGLILLSAHTGARHMAQVFLAGHAGRPVHVLGVKDRGDVDLEAHEHRGANAPYAVIDPAEGPGAVARMLHILRAKEILCIMGDRAFGSGATLAANFLGEPAPLPYLAFRMSAASGAPVAVVFHLRTGVCRGETRVADVIHVPAGLKNGPEAYRPYVQRFASLLEDFTAEHPYQFFNFFNLWEK
ncbi:MAG: lipid A biosynthesis acyltransferase [Desulfovibrio sp.]|jgi:predicted LPLAT superfamily acyltransferase|nr:lipid A biosynthesis acyltransferase [Desulfovibrio sp.]